MQPGRSTPPLGSSSFLNKPIGSGKTTGPQIDITNGRPSILAGRKPSQNPDNNGQYVDGTNIAGRPGSTNANHGSPQDGGLSHGRPSAGTKTTGHNLTPYNQLSGGSSDPSSSGRQQPNRGGLYDSSSSGLPDSGRTHVLGGDRLQPDQSRTGGSSHGKPSTDAFGQHPNLDAGGEGGVPNIPSTDVLADLRRAFNLPPGLCLVKCNVLRPDQKPLTPEQIRDAFEPTTAGGK